MNVVNKECVGSADLPPPGNHVAYGVGAKLFKSALYIVLQANINAENCIYVGFLLVMAIIHINVFKEGLYFFFLKK